jgi:hypothetical protein
MVFFLNIYGPDILGESTINLSRNERAERCVPSRAELEGNAYP